MDDVYVGGVFYCWVSVFCCSVDGVRVGAGEMSKKFVFGLPPLLLEFTTEGRRLTK